MKAASAAPTAPDHRGAGPRRAAGRAASLQWRDVDLQHRRVRLLAHKTKDGEERVLPVSDALAAVPGAGEERP